MPLKLPMYFRVGSRPVRFVPTPDGGMDVEALDWQTGQFVRAMEYSTRILVDNCVEADELSQEEFDRDVEEARRRIASRG